MDAKVKACLDHIRVIRGITINNMLPIEILEALCARYDLSDDQRSQLDQALSEQNIHPVPERELPGRNIVVDEAAARKRQVARAAQVARSQIHPQARKRPDLVAPTEEDYARRYAKLREKFLISEERSKQYSKEMPILKKAISEKATQSKDDDPYRIIQSAAVKIYGNRMHETEGTHFETNEFQVFHNYIRLVQWYFSKNNLNEIIRYCSNENAAFEYQMEEFLAILLHNIPDIQIRDVQDEQNG